MGDPTWHSELVRLRERRGDPRVEEVAERSGVHPATVAELLAGSYLPRLEILLSVVRALDGDPATFTRLWRGSLARALAGVAGPGRPRPSQRPPQLLDAILDELVLLRQTLDAALPTARDRRTGRRRPGAAVRPGGRSRAGTPSP